MASTIDPGMLNIANLAGLLHTADNTPNFHQNAEERAEFHETLQILADDRNASNFGGISHGYWTESDGHYEFVEIPYTTATNPNMSEEEYVQAILQLLDDAEEDRLLNEELQQEDENDFDDTPIHGLAMTMEHAAAMPPSLDSVRDTILGLSEEDYVQLILIFLEKTEEKRRIKRELEDEEQYSYAGSQPNDLDRMIQPAAAVSTPSASLKRERDEEDDDYIDTKRIKLEPDSEEDHDDIEVKSFKSDPEDEEYDIDSKRIKLETKSEDDADDNDVKSIKPDPEDDKYDVDAKDIKLELESNDDTDDTDAGGMKAEQADDDIDVKDIKWDPEDGDIDTKSIKSESERDDMKRVKLEPKDDHNIDTESVKSEPKSEEDDIFCAYPTLSVKAEDFDDEDLDCEDMKQEDVKQEDVKQEDVKQEDVKQEDVKQEFVKQEFVKQEIVKQEIVKHEFVKQEIVKHEDFE